MDKRRSTKMDLLPSEKFLKMSDHDLAKMTRQNFNNKLKMPGLSPKKINMMKQRKRMLENQNAAQCTKQIKKNQADNKKVKNSISNFIKNPSFENCDLINASKIKGHTTNNQQKNNINLIGNSKNQFKKSSQVNIKGPNINNVNLKNLHKEKQKNEENDLPKFICDHPELKKYFYKRYKLFSKFDLGIQIDYESWYSVTPEEIANQIAKRCKCDIIVDAFCGVGGNSIAFASTCKKVYAIDIDPQKIECAKDNAKIYGVEDKIEFIVGDFFNLAERLFADVVFLSPPWGGLEYNKTDIFDLKDILPLNGGGLKLFEIAKKISNNVAYIIYQEILMNHNSRVWLQIVNQKLIL